VVPLLYCDIFIYQCGLCKYFAWLIVLLSTVVVSICGFKYRNAAVYVFVVGMFVLLIMTIYEEFV
jgi:hypothetical protein